LLHLLLIIDVIDKANHISTSLSSSSFLESLLVHSVLVGLKFLIQSVLSLEQEVHRR
jgi:hypothetical protein